MQVAAKLVAEHKASESAHLPAGPSSGHTWFLCFGNHKPNSLLTHVTSVCSAFPFFKRVPIMMHSPDTQLNVLQDTTILNHAMYLPGPFSISRPLRGLCSLDLGDCRQLLFFLLQLMRHLCSTSQDGKLPVPCSVGRNGCQ